MTSKVLDGMTPSKIRARFKAGSQHQRKSSRKKARKAIKNAVKRAGGSNIW